LLAQKKHEALVLEHPLDRAQPLRALGIVRRGDVVEADGMGDENVIGAFHEGQNTLGTKT
jgi:hypothetical protein